MNWREKEERVRSTSERTGAARIEITNHGPYRVTGDVVIFDAEGNLLRARWHVVSVPLRRSVATSRSVTSRTG